MSERPQLEPERWTFTIEVPAGVRHGACLVRSALKVLLRRFGLRCVAVREAPADPEPQRRDNPP